MIVTKRVQQSVNADCPHQGPLPAIFGLNIATYVLLDLAGKPFEPLAIKNRRKLYSVLHTGLSEREQRWQGMELQATIQISIDDMGYIFEDLHYGRSSFAPHVILPKPQAIRWDRSKELLEDNVAIMTLMDAKKHEAECLKGGQSLEEVWGKEQCEVVRKRHEEARRVITYRRQ